MTFFGGHFMWIFWVLVVGVVIVAIVMISQKNNKSKSGLDILKKRYAKGEITKKEFEEKKHDLQA